MQQLAARRDQRDDRWHLRWAGQWDGWRQDLAIATALGVFLAAIGPYGSYLNGPFWQRACFQLPCCWLGVGLTGTLVRLAAAAIPGGLKLWAAIAASAAVAMVPVTLLNIAIAHALWPFLSHVMTPAKWYGDALLIAEPASFGFALLARHRNAAAAAPALPAATPIQQDPGQLAAAPCDVLCLQMEDHYVRVHTRRGSHLVLTTFGQAQEAMGRFGGLRVHRSWWVADAAIAGARRDGRNLRLVLVNGLSVPVSRTSVTDVRAKGWLADAP